MRNPISASVGSRPAWRPAALLATVCAAAIGTLWLSRPDLYPFGSQDRVTVSVTHRIEHSTAGTLLVVSAMLGALALAGASIRRTPLADRLALVAALVQTLFFGLVMTDASVMSLLGYAVAFAGPAIVVTAVIAACLRRNVAGYLIAGTAVAVGIIGVTTGLIEPEVVTTFWSNVSHSFESFGTRLGWSVLMAGMAVTWGWATARLVGWSRWSQSQVFTSPAKIRRWGRAVTFAAALCPLPYAGLRLLWLTPWPVDLRADMDRPEVRMQGAFLGVAALVGCTLTLGLISRWGEVFPRWLPFLGGRAVPPALAVVPGGLVAAAATMAGPGLLLSGIESNGAGHGVAGVALTVLIFPFPIWGPLLGAAVLAYHLRRRADSGRVRPVVSPRRPGGAPLRL
ncbi:hypothetical protein [Kribbella sp. VKM Ac-2571]|uniref:hypothetical protein n=1 Tax=Kribbella sp. VKM Ac-2571 TaxID=2512222 RepID=UPI0010610DE5|nr:hypothetical protein [Kribbella sp. VKM Ac-2571]